VNQQIIAHILQFFAEHDDENSASKRVPRRPFETLGSSVRDVHNGSATARAHERTSRDPEFGGTSLTHSDELIDRLRAVVYVLLTDDRATIFLLI